MEARHGYLAEQRARTERRRGLLIITATTLFAVAMRVLML